MVRVILGSFLFVATASLAVAAATPSQKCTVAKMKAVGKRTAAILACYEKAIGKGVAVDPACLAKVDLAFPVAFTKAEKKIVCEGNADDLRAESDAFVEQVVAALPTSAPTPGPGVPTPSPTRTPTGAFGDPCAGFLDCVQPNQCISQGGAPARCGRSCSNDDHCPPESSGCVIMNNTGFCALPD